MATFSTISWNDGWKRSIRKFKELRETNDVVSRSFFQRKNELLVEVCFSNGDFVVLSQDILEKNI